MEWIQEAGGRLSNGAFSRNIETNIDDYEAIREAFNNTDVYTTVYAYGDDELLYAPFYLDMDGNIDSEISYQKVRKDTLAVVRGMSIKYGIPEEEICIYFSGSKGFHIMVDPRIMDIEPCKDLNLIFKSMAKELEMFARYNTIDMGIYDSRRLLRLNNSINSKTGLYKVQVTRDFLYESNWESMKEFASTHQPEWFPASTTVLSAAAKYRTHVSKLSAIKAPKASTRPITMPTQLLPCMQRLLDQGAQQGNRNQSAVILASALLQIGQSDKEMAETIESWNETKNEPSLPHSEIASIIKSASAMHAAGKRYGCSTIRDLDLCISSCRLNK